MYIAVRDGPVIFKLLAVAEKALLIRRDALLSTDLLLNALDGIRQRYVDCDRLAREGLHNKLFPFLFCVHPPLLRQPNPQVASRFIGLRSPVRFIYPRVIWVHWFTLGAEETGQLVAGLGR